jgi:hypothetical protein
VAAEEAAQAKPDSFSHPISVDGLRGIDGAAREKAASAGQQGGEKKTIPGDDADNGSLTKSNHHSQRLRFWEKASLISSATWLRESRSAPFLAIMTTSW